MSWIVVDRKEKMILSDRCNRFECLSGCDVALLTLWREWKEENQGEAAFTIVNGHRLSNWTVHGSKMESTMWIFKSMPITSSRLFQSLWNSISPILFLTISLEGVPCIFINNNAFITSIFAYNQSSVAIPSPNLTRITPSSFLWRPSYLHWCGSILILCLLWLCVPGWRTNSCFRLGPTQLSFKGSHLRRSGLISVFLISRHSSPPALRTWAIERAGAFPDRS
jgi:hypothetical protein